MGLITNVCQLQASIMGRPRRGPGGYPSLLIMVVVPQGLTPSTHFSR